MTAAFPMPSSTVSAPLADFLERARTRLHAAPSGDARRGDYDLMPELRGHLDGLIVRDAAVLIPVIARPEPTILLTLRSSHLPSHAGQIAFPGGKVDAGDTDALATALREAEEEVGLARELVTPLGYLDTYESRTGFRIAPVVGIVQPEFGLTLNPGEVDEAFEVPLDFLMSPTNHQRHSRETEGMRRTFHAMAYDKRFIWGVTAGILRNLYERMYG